jgi:hypothetical protein
MTVSRQQISERVPMAMNTHATIKLLLEMVFSTQSMQRGYKEGNWFDAII